MTEQKQFIVVIPCGNSESAISAIVNAQKSKEAMQQLEIHLQGGMIVANAFPMGDGGTLVVLEKPEL
jgi:hypothetical protein